MVIYEWADAKYLGNATGSADEDLPVSSATSLITFRNWDFKQKTYICTSSAVLSGFCTREQLGRFILDLPNDKTINDTSFWSARVDLPANKTSASPTSAITADSLWDNPAGNPTPPASQYDSPWRRRSSFSSLVPFKRQINSSPADMYSYTSPISYPVRKTGFYCVGELHVSRVIKLFLNIFPSAAIPVTVQSLTSETDITHHPSYNGLVLFKNTFDGKLAATDYPKVNVCVGTIRKIIFSNSICIVLFRHVHRIFCLWDGLGLVVLSTHARVVTNSSKPRFSCSLVFL